MVSRKKKAKTTVLALSESLNEPWGTVSPIVYKEREGSVVWRAVLFTSGGSGPMI